MGSGRSVSKLGVPADSVCSSGDAWAALAWKLLWLIPADTPLLYFLTCVLAYVTLRLSLVAPSCFSPFVTHHSGLFYTKQYRHLAASWLESRPMLKEALCPSLPAQICLALCLATQKSNRCFLCNFNFFPVCILCMKIFGKKFANNAPLNVSVLSITL